MLVNASEEAQRNVLANSNAQDLLNLGVMLRTQGLFDEALEIFERLIERNPHDYLARTYAGMMYLQQGRWEAGWKLYRARWLSPGWERLAYQVEHLWDGELREGLQLLVWAEQGYGDAIQFSRYFHWLMDQGVDVVFQGPVALHSLFERSFPSLKLLSDGATVAVDAHVPMLDLVITVDTVVAHLAGAMGKPVWMLLPFVPDWRWGCMGSSTAWYPSMTLFRQGDSMAWSPVLEKAAIELHQRVRTTSW